MAEEQKTVAPVNTGRGGGRGRSLAQGAPSSRILRNLLIGVGIALLLILIELILWIVSPLHGHGTPLLLLIPLLTLVATGTVVQIADRPLALLAYLREVQKAQEPYAKTYVPLSADPNSDDLEQNVSLLELVRQQGTHQLILGAAGAGKTMLLRAYLYSLAQQGPALIRQRQKIPLFVPLKDYSLFLERQQGGASSGDTPARATLLDFLSTSDLAGMRYTRPHMRKLLERGRLLLLCDGLNEIAPDLLEDVGAELAQLMQRSENRLLVTCREVEYRRLPELERIFADALLEQVMIYPLGEQQKRLFVERSIKGQEPDNRRQQMQLGQQHTAGQIMELIRRTRLRYHCSSPMMLAMLMGMIDGIGLDRARRMDTRGRLTREAVAQLIRREQRQSGWGSTPPASNEVLLFLSELAYAARRAHARYAMQLPVAGLERGATALTPARMQELADGLQRWLDEHPAETPFASEGGGFALVSRHEAYTREQLAQLLTFAQGTSLLEISPGGIVSFRQELIAEYLAAEYFVSMASPSPAPMMTNNPTTRSDVVMVGASLAGALGVGLGPGDELLADVAYWSESIILWAGLLDSPLDVAQRFADLSQRAPGYRIEALALSLFCIGVLEAPPQAEAAAAPVSLPAGVEAALASVLREAEACERLARIFTRCAEEEDGQEVYRSLLLLLLVDGIEELLLRLDQVVVSELLFGYLVESIDVGARDAQVRRLMRILGRFGSVAVAHAAELSRPAAQRSGRLRSAAINILGSTNDQQAVEPLVACLGDSNAFIVERAINALIRLGPERTLPLLMQALANRRGSSVVRQTHLAILNIFEKYLDEPQAVRQLTPPQHQQILEALLPVMTSNYAVEAQQKAREILARQGNTAGVRESGEKTIELLIRNLAASDETMASNAVHTLKAIGPTATPMLLVQLKQHGEELVRARIVEVLGHVRDQRALPDLLRSMEDPAPVVQQRVASALLHYAPASIPGLIDLVLSNESDAVAHGAEQVLISIGRDVVEPVIQVLQPGPTESRPPGRTLFLVHVLGEVHDVQAVPALIELLEPALADPPLALAIVHTLGQFPDPRIVPPLLAVLASSHPLLYEGASNALSNLGEVAVEPLIAALDVEQTTVVVPRVERTLLGMAHFPGQALIEALAHGSDAQASHIVEVFLSKGSEAAHLLVHYLFDPDARLQRYARQTVNKMEGQVVVPALLEIVNHPEQGWRELITAYLLKHPQEAIPPLISLLGEYERADAAESILIQFGPVVLPLIGAGLDAHSSVAQKRAEHVVVAQVRQRPEILPRVIQLFSLPLSARAREVVLDILTDDLFDLSVPALLEGLEDAHLVGDVAEALVRMLRKRDAQSEHVMEALLGALRVDERRHGASIALIEASELAVHPVGDLITDPERAVALAAQEILGEIGVPAFSFLWAAQSDTNNRTRRDAARNVFRHMPTVVIKDELVALLASDTPDNISMALALLLERIHDESQQSHTEHEMIPALLEHVHMHEGERASLRIIALLLLLGNNMVIDHMAQTLFDYPDHQERLLYAFLLLGSDAEKLLLDVFADPQMPPGLRAEIAGVLGLLGEHGDVVEYAQTVGESGLWAARSINRTGVLQPEHLAVSLRALGGLLASGQWDMGKLQSLRKASIEGSAVRELYDVLLGWRYSPQIRMLENDLQAERDEHEKHVRELSKELLMRQLHVKDLEHDLEQVRSEHDTRVEELRRAAQEKQILHENLQQREQEKQGLHSNVQQLAADVQQLSQERERLRVQNEQWRAYCEQLEQELKNLSAKQSP